jgi:hypothetical protein
MNIPTRLTKKSRGLELSAFPRVTRSSVPQQSGKHQQHSRKNRNGPEPDREPRRPESVPLNLRELADGNGDAANRKTEHDDCQAGAQPGEKGAFVCKVIAGGLEFSPAAG